MSSDGLYIGVDAGGSKTELLACTASEQPKGVEECFRGPGANPKRAGREETTRVLADLVHQALSSRPGASLRAMCAGIAGADSQEERKRLANQLRRALGDEASGARLTFVDDARIALETAFARRSGVVVGAGTGSVVLARPQEGPLVRAGGWGYILGDQGSGYALGRAGLRAVACAWDGGPSTRLRSLLADEHELDTREKILRSVYEERHSLQDMAVLVLRAAEAGDAVAARLLKKQTRLLAQQVDWLVERHPAIASRIGLFGGLTNSSIYVGALQRALGDLLSSWTTEVVSTPPVTGALHLALDQLDRSPAGITSRTQ